MASKTAKGFVLDGDDTPIIFAVVDGQPGAAMYKPAAALVPGATSNLPALAKVGDFTPVSADSTVAGGPTIVTGAAKSADGKKVVVRTAGYAYEYDVPDGKVVDAITKSKPRVTQLPNEPDGEAIAYTADGTKFLTLGAKPTGATENAKLLSYTPFVPAADTAPADPGGGQKADSGGGGLSGFIHSLTLNQLTRIVAAVGVVGLVLAIAGIVGIRRARRRRREEEEEYDDDYYDDRPRRRGGRPGRVRPVRRRAGTRATARAATGRTGTPSPVTSSPATTSTPSRRGTGSRATTSTAAPSRGTGSRATTSTAASTAPAVANTAVAVATAGTRKSSTRCTTRVAGRWS